MTIDFLKVPNPCYLLEERLLRKNLRLIQSVKEEAGVDIILAFKGFSMWKAFPIIREYISGAAASGAYEAKLAADEMKTLAHTYSPAFQQSDFNEVLENSSHITFNSLSQLERFLPDVKNFPRKISVGIRVNPEFSEVETELYNPCAPGTRLGILADQLGDELPEGIEGFHFHTLCESTALDLEKTLVAFENKFGKYLSRIKWVNMGGGHLMTRNGYDTEKLINILKAFRQRWNIEVILEPGSAFAWETGVLVAQVVDIVENKGIKTAILNVSFTAHMPDCLEMPYKPRIRDAYHEPVEGKPTYRMGGNSCLAGDFLGFWSFENELRPEDRIIFEDMIHYTIVKSSMFNGVPHPSIGMWCENGEFKLLRAFDYLDYKNRMA
ncbi:MAG TPA: carboxynorspermidine decarboxylase [Prolixibacteraceae bacterium]|nr:carboxynorspermidine decarboxylase [Prolixibacteraceae bacterium]